MPPAADLTSLTSQNADNPDPLKKPQNSRKDVELAADRVNGSKSFPQISQPDKIWLVERPLQCYA